MPFRVCATKNLEPDAHERGQIESFLDLRCFKAMLAPVPPEWPGKLKLRSSRPSFGLLA